MKWGLHIGLSSENTSDLTDPKWTCIAPRIHIAVNSLCVYSEHLNMHESFASNQHLMGTVQPEQSFCWMDNSLKQVMNIQIFCQVCDSFVHQCKLLCLQRQLRHHMMIMHHHTAPWCRWCVLFCLTCLYLSRSAHCSTDQCFHAAWKTWKSIDWFFSHENTWKLIKITWK